MKNLKVSEKLVSVLQYIKQGHLETNKKMLLDSLNSMLNLSFLFVCLGLTGMERMT